MELTPASDTWIDTARLEAKIIQTEGDYTATLNGLADSEGVDPQTGIGPIIWNSWETTWTGTTTRDFESGRWSEETRPQWLGTTRQIGNVGELSGLDGLI